MKKLLTTLGSILIIVSPVMVVISCNGKNHHHPITTWPVIVHLSLDLPGITESSSMSLDINNNIFLQQKSKNGSSASVYRGIIQEHKWSLNQKYSVLPTTPWIFKQNMHILEIGSVLNKPNFGIFSDSGASLVNNNGELAFNGKCGPSSITGVDYVTAAIIDQVGASSGRWTERAGKPGILCVKSDGTFDYIDGYQQKAEYKQTQKLYKAKGMPDNTKINTAFSLPITDPTSGDYHFAYFLGTNHGLYRLYDFTAANAHPSEAKYYMDFNHDDSDIIKNISSYQRLHNRLYLFDLQNQNIYIVKDLCTSQENSSGEPASLHPFLISLGSVKNNPLVTITKFNISADLNNNLFIGVQGYGKDSSSTLISKLFYYNSSTRIISLISNNLFNEAKNIVPTYLLSPRGNTEYAVFSVLKQHNYQSIITDVFTRYPGPHMPLMDITKVFTMISI